LHRSLFACLTLLLAGCLMQPAAVPPDAASPEADRLLISGLSELLENRPLTSFDSLLAHHPHTQQADLATRLLDWKRQYASELPTAPTTPPTPPTIRKTAPSESDLRELKEENRRLRGDLEQLRRLLIESERRSR